MQRATLHKPFVVFDSGIGSYAVVEVLRRQYPQQDILYIADRASFPYGAKDQEALRRSVQRVIDFAVRSNPSVIVLASNAPSVMVLGSLSVPSGVAIRGIYPPVKEALARSESKSIVVMGARSLLESAPYSGFLAAETKGIAYQHSIASVTASDMIELVESGLFLSDPSTTQGKVANFVDRIRERYPRADTYTLSSTHLPWLRRYFEDAAPGMGFLDPADTVAQNLTALTTAGSGSLQILTTLNDQFPVEGFADILHRLGITTPFSVCEL